ncbi:hypothetical protein PRZ48_009883 [Zasmidium cellare]|uniref:DUF6604 domain-containing protein n=1 Tax=Zasmidium cellare TaxID=395010 RepID=A0ABR0ECY7_ZASCE|nr:hypothetical protein PRZ48_009883 [Zasmidium cellare]
MSSPLADLYRRYKIGTKHVEQWLTDLANRELHLRGTSVCKAINAFPENTAAPSEPEKLSTKQLIAVTDQIVESAVSRGKAPADLNSTIIVLEDVIHGRREYGIWHQLRAGDNKDDIYDRETASHEHFVDVLSEILTRLKEIQSVCQQPFKKQRGGKKNGGKAKKESKQATPTIDADDIEGVVRSCVYRDSETEEARLDSLADDMNDISVKEPTTKPPASVKVELQRPEDEDEFALWCFLKECHTVRLYLRSIWQEYYAGELSLLVAAEVTESGFIMISRAAWRFTLDYPRLASFDQVADRLQIRAQMRGSEVESFAFEDRSNANDSLNTGEALDMLCFPAFAALHALKQALRALRDNAQDTDELCELSDSCHFLNVKMLTALLEMLEMPNRLFKLMSDGKNFDFFTVVFLARMHTEKTQLFIDEVMQYQLYMDIVDFQKGLTPGFQTLCTVRDYVQDSALLYETQAPPMMEACGVKYDGASTYRHAALEFIQDVLFKHPDDDEKRLLVRGPAARNLPYIAELCGNFPVLCGRASNYLLRQNHVDGVLACRQHPLVMALAHLYRASLEAGLLHRRWKDMDLVIDVLGPVNLGFIGTLGSHTTIIVSARRFGMAFGIPAAEYSKEHRNRQHKRATARLPLPQTDHVAKEKDKTDLPKSPCTNAMLQRHKTGEMLGLNEPQSISYAIERMTRDILSDSSIVVDDDACKQWAASKTLDITTLLKVLKKQMIEEENLCCFDLHCFSVQAGRRLSAIRDEFGPSVAASRARQGLSRDFNMVEMVDEILWASVGNPSQSSLLGRVAIGLDAMIQKHDSELLEAGAMFAERLKLKDDNDEHPYSSKPQTSVLEGIPGMAMTGSEVKLIFQKLPPDEKQARLRKVYVEMAAEYEKLEQSSETKGWRNPLESRSHEKTPSPSG